MLEAIVRCGEYLSCGALVNEDGAVQKSGRRDDSRRGKHERSRYVAHAILILRAASALMPTPGAFEMRSPVEQRGDGRTAAGESACGANRPTPDIWVTPSDPHVFTLSRLDHGNFQPFGSPGKTWLEACTLARDDNFGVDKHQRRNHDNCERT